ncbi:MAG TPA: mannitol dehydrogenase family protein [Castellaniella sp.]|nr:mannitol dehydrogenase family protein [Castellaniella sp.]
MTPPRLDAAWLARARRGGAPGSRHDPGLPAYLPQAHGVGIVHLGTGAFHKAHQAVYTDELLSRQGGDWRIQGVSLRSESVAASMNPQDGLYTLLVRHPEGTAARVIGSIAGVIAAVRDPAAVLDALGSPAVRIVTLSVTEKAYGIDRHAGGLLSDHPAIVHDLAHPEHPIGPLGILSLALRRRHARGIEPFTVLCCDNLPDNGRLLRSGVLDMTAAVDPALRAWMAEDVAFPSSMVDRITPASTARTRADASALMGYEDHAAVETEPFSMWVIEDRFPAGRPAWEQAGALMVDDVAPYEQMKLRMLNGAHSLLAYAGHVAGYRHVKDAMSDAALASTVRRLMDAAADSLDRKPGLDLQEYARSLCARFANRAIEHETYQIAMDGTEKIPQRILAAAHSAWQREDDIEPFAFAIAAWMRYCLGRTDAGVKYALRDPREAELQRRANACGHDAAALAQALMLEDLFPQALRASPVWQAQLAVHLQRMLDSGMQSACRAFIAGGPRP